MTTTQNSPKTHYTPKEVARELGRHVNAIYKAIHRGALRADQLGERGEYLIPLSELQKKLPGTFGDGRD